MLWSTLNFQEGIRNRNLPVHRYVQAVLSNKRLRTFALNVGCMRPGGIGFFSGLRDDDGASQVGCDSPQFLGIGARSHLKSGNLAAGVYIPGSIDFHRNQTRVETTLNGLKLGC